LTFNGYQKENSVPNKTKLFQGQEHIDDLGLNWDSFKWRNHQPEIGRFFNVDPLSEKYVYNSTYAFSENKVTTHVELEGLEAVRPEVTGSGPDAGVTKDGTAYAHLAKLVVKVPGDENNGAVLTTTLLGGEAKAPNEKGGGLEIKGSAVTIDAKVKLGNKDTNVSYGFNIVGGGVNLEAGSKADEKGFGLKNAGGAQAAKLTGTLSVTILGVKVEAAGTGVIGGVDLKAKIFSNKSEEKGKTYFGGTIRGAYGAGGGVLFKVSY
jgi:RHS repeat-associated protein